MCNVRSAIGLIQEGDLVINDWVDPPLHLICSKRMWATSIADILKSKKEYKDVTFFIVAFSLGGLDVIFASFQTLFHTNVQCTHIL